MEMLCPSSRSGVYDVDVSQVRRVWDQALSAWFSAGIAIGIDIDLAETPLRRPQDSTLLVAGENPATVGRHIAGQYLSSRFS